MKDRRAVREIREHRARYMREWGPKFIRAHKKAQDELLDPIIRAVQQCLKELNHDT